MTDEQIIKALECHSNDYTFCMECPLTQKGECSCELSRKALDLINRQKAEIERLEQNLEEAYIDIKEHQAHIRNLKMVIDKIEDHINPLPFETDYDKAIKTAKAEAVKEFAERLKVLCRQARFSVRVTQDLTGIQRLLDNIAVVDEDDIDNLVKEMVGAESG